MKPKSVRDFTVSPRALAVMLAALLSLTPEWPTFAQNAPPGEKISGPGAVAAPGQTPAENGTQKRENDPDKGVGGTGASSLPSSRPDPIPQLPETNFGGPGGVGTTGGPPDPIPDPPLPPIQSPPIQMPPIQTPGAEPPAPPVEPVRPPEAPTPGP